MQSTLGEEMKLFINNKKDPAFKRKYKSNIPELFNMYNQTQKVIFVVMLHQG